MTIEKNLQWTPLQKMAVTRKLMEAEIVSRAWADGDFRAKLETDPTAALREAKLPVPEGKTLQIISEMPNVVTIILPARPEQGAEVADEELVAVAGGSLLQNGRCRVYEDFKFAQEQGDLFAQTQTAVSSAIVSVFGGSWGWGA